MGRESNSDSMQASWKNSFLKAGKGLLNMLPVIIGVVLLVGLFKTFVSQEMIALLFKDNPVIDGVIGSFIGSILTGNAVTSYIIGHELIIKEVSLFAVTAFMVSWVTVGIIQLPAEMAALGKRFSLLRNGISFLLSFIVAGFVAIVIGAVL